jgi:hypothetical protein
MCVEKLRIYNRNCMREKLMLNTKLENIVTFLEDNINMKVKEIE